MPELRVDERVQLRGERDHPAPGKIGLRRITAFAVDQLLIGLWVGAISLASWLTRVMGWVGEPTPPSDFADKAIGHAASFLVLTLPVLLYFTLFEAWHRASIGKRTLRLRVVDGHGERLSTGRSLLRNALKLAPWELSHVAIWYVPGRPFLDPPATWSVIAWLVALAVAALWLLSLFTAGHRTLYDRLAGARVVDAKDGAELAAAWASRAEADGRI